MNINNGVVLAALAMTACTNQMDGTAVTVDQLRAIESICSGAGCEDQTDSKVAGGGGNAVASTSAEATSLGIANAERDAKSNARRLLSVPNCKGDCKQLGGLHKDATVLPGTSKCPSVMQAEQPPSPDRDADGNGVDDWWATACWRMHNRNIGTSCSSSTSVALLPWFSFCGSHAKATGLRVCVDNLCACEDLVDQTQMTACMEAESEAEAEAALDL